MPVPALRAAVEAVLLVATEPVTTEALAAATNATTSETGAAVAYLAEEYRGTGRGFEIVQVAGGHRLRTTADTQSAVVAYLGGGKPSRLSAASLEALAVVAYKQPISRAQVSAVRGVNSDSVVRTLIDRGYVAEVGRDPDAPNVELLGTTAAFLSHLGLNALDQLPSLADVELDDSFNGQPVSQVVAKQASEQPSEQPAADSRAATNA